MVGMANLEHYRMRVQYKGLHGLSEIGFKRRETLLADLFPTADEIVLSIAACFCRLDESAAVISEVPEFRRNRAALELHQSCWRFLPVE